MEAAILTSESPKGLTSSLTGGGNALSESGSASPFSTILQSQQASVRTNTTRTTSTTVSTEAADPLFSGAQNYPSLQQLSIASSEGAAAVPWLTLQAQTGGEHDVLGADGLQTLESPTTEGWVDPALLNVDTQAPQMKELPALISNLGINAKQGDPLVSAVGGNGVEPALFESSGGGGQAGQAFQTNGGLPLMEGVDSVFPRTGTVNPLQVGAEALTEGAEPTVVTPIQSQQLAAGARLDGSTAGDSGFDVTHNAGAALNGSAGVSGLENQGGAEQLLRSEAAGASVDKSVSPVSEPDLSAAQLRSVATSESESAEGTMTAVKPAGGEDVGLDGAAVLRSTASVSTEGKSSELKDASNSGEGVELPETRLGTLASDKQRSAEVAAQVASTNSGSTQGQTNPATVSATDAMSTQVRTAMQPQAKKGEAAERVDSKIATNGSEGYHWLDSGAEATVTSGSEIPQIDRSIDGASGGMASVSTGPTSNTAVRNDSAVESFSSVKQAVDVAQTAEAKSTELSDTAKLEIETSVRDAQWSQAFAYRVQFMATQGIQRAQVQLNPAELGPMEITVDIVDDVAQVQITAEQAATKEAVEQAIPRLREMMAQSGFGETQVDLSSTSDESTASAGDAQLMNNANNSAGGEGAGSNGDNSARTTEVKVIETLAANERPTRTADGRMSFYV